jgi:hypothetical protein
MMMVIDRETRLLDLDLSVYRNTLDTPNLH